jgi:predicted enzyme related to lactoylglutathione lyase
MDTCPCSILSDKKDVCSSTEVLASVIEAIPIKKKDLKDVPNTNDASVVAVSVIKSVTGCDSEVCALNKIKKQTNDEDLKDKITKEIRTKFKPEGPMNNTNILSNFNIDQTLDQYALKYKNFYHIQFAMIDFKKYDTMLKKYNPIEEYKNGKTMAGCVINTDVSSGGGKHWMALFVDLRSSDASIEFFNSSGNAPAKEIVDWMIDIEKSINEYFTDSTPKILTNAGVVHQHSQTECGVYSLYYIISRIKVKPQKYFTENIVPDNEMVKFRKIIFRQENKQTDDNFWLFINE